MRIVGGALLAGAGFIVGAMAALKEARSFSACAALILISVLGWVLVLRDTNGRPLIRIEDGEYIVAASASYADKVFLLVQERISPPADRGEKVRLYELQLNHFRDWKPVKGCKLTVGFNNGCRYNFEDPNEPKLIGVPGLAS